MARWLSAFLLVVLFSTVAQAEVRTITATGEYRMGDNDTRTDAKRLALQDAKRLALEKAGTYIESLTEVRNFQLSLDEVRAYTAGIVEVTEQRTRSTMESDTQVILVDVTCKVDTAVVTRQIESLRKNQKAKNDLLRARQDNERLRRENEALNQKLAAATAKSEIDSLAQKRREVLTDQDVNSLLAQAWVALSGGDQGDRMRAGSSTAAGRSYAMALLTKARALDRDNIQVHINLGILFSEEGRWAEAITEYREALRLDPQAPHVHHNLAEILHRQGALSEALDEHRKAAAIKPDVSVYHAGLGQALQESGDLPAAIRAFREATRLEPDNAQWHSLLGDSLSAVEDWTGAVAAFQQAVALEPDDADYHGQLGYALANSGDLGHAAEEFNQASRLSPEDSTHHFNLAVTLAQLGRIADAKDEYRKALRLLPDTPGNHDQRDNIRERLGQLD